jgi:uncharacterized protein (DUF2267 family)
MTYDEFIDLVAQRAGISPEEAWRAVRATLKTLAQRITAGEAEDVAAELPEELRLALRDGEHPEAFDVQEFLQRIVAREGGLLDEATAERHARAVFAVLRRAVSAKEFHDMVSQLPGDIQERLVPATAAPATGGSG